MTELDIKKKFYKGETLLKKELAFLSFRRTYNKTFAVVAALLGSKNKSSNEKTVWLTEKEAKTILKQAIKLNNFNAFMIYDTWSEEEIPIFINDKLSRNIKIEIANPLNNTRNLVGIWIDSSFPYASLEMSVEEFPNFIQQLNPKNIKFDFDFFTDKSQSIKNDIEFKKNEIERLQEDIKFLEGRLAKEPEIREVIKQVVGEDFYEREELKTAIGEN